MANEMPKRRELAKQEEVQRLTAFRSDLKEILEKHGVILGVTMDGDTYGIHEAYVDISLKPLPNGHLHFVTEAVRLFNETE
ncbi:hypothetical protein A3715_15540 [Oleiphilus sp. HI0009]|nr:hypothetical protein A3715_15540 [Oleiphilus sp. HI0009]